MNLAAYRSAFEQLPAAIRERRRSAWERFESLGFPSRRIEEWHYTDLTALNDAHFEPAPAAQTPALTGLDGWEIRRFIAAGTQSPAGSSAPDGHLADDAVTALNAALAADGLNWRVPRNDRPAPLHVIQWSGGGMTHWRHRIALDAGAEATLLLDQRSDAAPGLTTTVLEIELGANAQLKLLRIQDAGSAATDLTRTQVRVARDAGLHYVGLDLGGALVRHDLNIHLAEPGSEAQVRGVFAPGGKSHCDTRSLIRHDAVNTTGRETFRALVMGRARGVFTGKIVVERGAQKTDSELSVASLLLSSLAEVNAKPELEIYADDVKCAHGATCGQLDETAIYYLRSRGLDAVQARNLLLFTFAHEVLGKVTREDARREMAQRLLARLPGGAELEELL